MLDYRIYTFLKLCETMNYRKTADILNMTQPAVTQHIHYLENIYQTKLFTYNNKKLTQTQKGKDLEQYARSVVYNEQKFKEQMLKPKTQHIAIGATKTIGNYILFDTIQSYLEREDLHFELIIDNTQNLLKKLNNRKLDYLIIEGFFNKSEYDYRLLCEEELIGICSKNHPFANQEIEFSAIFNQPLILREQGSGTRKVFENFLQQKNANLDMFTRHSVISSLSVIEKMVEKEKGISFVYRCVAQQNPNLATFRIKNNPIFHEFNYVYLKNTQLAI